jgi:WD domain, G-beta repeat
LLARAAFFQLIRPLTFGLTPSPSSSPPQCHRQKLPSGEERVFAVNALCFHPVMGTMATGGSDGSVCIWDIHSKKRVCALPEMGSSPVSSLAFSPDGKHIAIAASYSWEQGDPALLPKRPPPDAIHVRALTEAEVRPKPATAK